MQLKTKFLLFRFILSLLLRSNRCASDRYLSTVLESVVLTLERFLTNWPIFMSGPARVTSKSLFVVARLRPFHYVCYFTHHRPKHSLLRTNKRATTVREYSLIFLPGQPLPKHRERFAQH